VIDARRSRQSSAAGFSLVELLIATAVIGVILISLVPLFVQSARSNQSGGDSTLVANGARSRLEELGQIPFDNPYLAITTGTERQYFEYTTSGRDWVTIADASAAPNVAQFIRTTTIRQFDLADLSTPLPSTAPADSVGVKEIVVAVEGTRAAGNVLGAGQRLSVRTFKSK